MSEVSISKAGLACSVTASVLFGVVTWYVQLTGLSGTTLFLCRMVFSSLPLFVIIYFIDRCAAFRLIFACRKSLVILSIGAIISGFQWWLFIWAPVNGMAQELSLGYFLLPLTLALTGRIIFKEQLRNAQKIAIACAFIGGLAALYQHGSLPWMSVGVAGLYPFYFIIRRHAHVGTIPTLLFEHLIYVPGALYLLATNAGFIQQLQKTPTLWLLLPGLGLLCSLSLILYISASRKLSVTLFGLLSYLEPALVFFVAITLLHEPFKSSEWIVYGFVWLAAAIASIDSIRLIMTKKSHPFQEQANE